MKVASCDPGMNADLRQAYLFVSFLTRASQNAIAFLFIFFKELQHLSPTVIIMNCSGGFRVVIIALEC